MSANEDDDDQPDSFEVIERLRARVVKLEAALENVAKECSTFPIRDGLAFRCESIARAALKDAPDA